MGPTSYPEIDSVLDTLLAGSQTVLRENFLGMYLFGSLASGGFSEETSDIDFVVVTKSDIQTDERAGLERLNERIQATGSKWADKLEGSFLPLHMFRDFDPSYARYPSIGMGGKFGIGRKGIEHAIQRHMLREHGIALAGPDPKTFIDPVAPAELRDAAAGLLRSSWKPQLEDPSRMRRRGYQSYAVLTMCRALYTLANGAVASKPFAAQWVRERLNDRWRALIDRALDWKEGDGVDDLDETLELIRYTLGHVDAQSLR